MFKTPKQMDIDLPKVLDICEDLWSNENSTIFVTP